MDIISLQPGGTLISPSGSDKIDGIDDNFDIDNGSSLIPTQIKYRWNR